MGIFSKAGRKLFGKKIGSKITPWSKTSKRFNRHYKAGKRVLQGEVCSGNLNDVEYSVLKAAWKEYLELSPGGTFADFMSKLK